MVARKYLKVVDNVISGFCCTATNPTSQGLATQTIPWITTVYNTLADRTGPSQISCCIFAKVPFGTWVLWFASHFGHLQVRVSNQSPMPLWQNFGAVVLGALGWAPLQELRIN